MLGGRYRVLDRIGSGGMAEVFRARDEVLDRPVAVKVFKTTHVAPDDDARGLERQQLEVAALARLNHPNLIALYDGSIGSGDGPAFIVMELIDGPSLAARIAGGPLPEASVREIAIQLADGLAYVHAQGMVHRDVKPENILLGVDRSDDDSTVRARLSDFGIVRLLGSERLTSADLTLGTASYLAPEQARGSHVDPPADIYALGLVLLEALTGRRMYDGPALEAALARLSQRPEIPAGLPEPWPGLLYAMTETDPRLRPSATEVARVLRNEGSRALPLVPLAVPVAAGFAEAPTGMVPVAAAAGSEPAPPAAPHRRRPSGMVIAAALSLLVILTTLGIFLFAGNGAKSPAQTPAGRSPAAEQSVSSSSSSGSKSPSGGPHTGPAVAPVVKHHSTSASSNPASSSAPATSQAPTRASTSAQAPTTAPRTSSAAHSTPAAPATKPRTSPATSSTPTQPAGSTSAGSTAATSAGATSPAAAGSTTAS